MMFDEIFVMVLLFFMEIVSLRLVVWGRSWRRFRVLMGVDFWLVFVCI